VECEALHRHAFETLHQLLDLGLVPGAAEKSRRHLKQWPLEIDVHLLDRLGIQFVPVELHARLRRLQRAGAGSQNEKAYDSIHGLSFGSNVKFSLERYS